MKDATVYPPAAVLHIGGNGHFDLPTPEELLLISEAERKKLQDELKELKVTASTIANIAICLAKIRRDELGEVIIPGGLSKRMEGAQIFLRKDEEGNIIVNHRERGLYPVEKED